MILQDLMKTLETLAPLHLAESWDNVGLLLGDPSTEIRNVMTCLTITSEVVQEAISQKADVIVAHHPILFRPTKSIRADRPGSDLVWRLARSGVSVISHHTGWDSAEGGANDYIASGLGLVDVRPLNPTPAPACVKFTVFVPEANLEDVRKAAFQSGAGHIGLYDECSFSTLGLGTFRGQENANPTMGKIGIRENVKEYRLEIISPKALQNQVLSAIKNAHPYEEPAVDIYDLAGVAKISNSGVGRFGFLRHELSLRELAQWASQQFRSRSTQMAIANGSTQDAMVSRVAIACGAGDDLVDLALKHGADVLVTGELRFHTMLKAYESGLHTILLGHYASERPSMESIAQSIQIKHPDLRVWASVDEPDPLVNL